MIKFKQKEIQGIAQYIFDNLDEYEGLNNSQTLFNMFTDDFYNFSENEAIERMGANVYDIIGELVYLEKEYYKEVITDFSNPQQILESFIFFTAKEIFDSLGDVEDKKEIKKYLQRNYNITK